MDRASRHKTPPSIRYRTLRVLAIGLLMCMAGRPQSVAAAVTTTSAAAGNSNEIGRGEMQEFATDGEIHRVLVNGSAQIKCDVSSNIPDDQVLLVVWYKDNLPIYSYDTRGNNAIKPSHWRDEEVLEDRAVFRTQRQPAELIITPVLEKDVGNFRCRVDFKKTQTRNSNVNLEVVVPPQQPKIFNERGEPIESRAGPYEEGADLQLICVVMGGSPPPTITWLSGGHVLPSTVLDHSFPQALNNKLVIHNLSRSHQHQRFTCHASNFHKSGVAANVTVELHLRPLSVDITFANQPLSSDRPYEVECEAAGSRPPAKITWWMGGLELKSLRQKVSPDGNVTTSTLQLTPTRQDNGKTLMCRATNELLKRGTKETVMKLNVCFVPTLLLELGSNLNPEDIEEGDDVYFECKVHANPAAYKVIWKHNGQTIQHNPKAGVIVSAGDLAIQGVSRQQAGNYSCIASNVEGDGESNTVALKVMYKPLCRADQKKVYGVARNEAAHILCEVDAFPPPVTFKWSFNNTAETLDMPQSGFEKHSPRASKLTYIPIKELDFGTIMCWADNVVGQQKEPCVFHLIAAGKPDAPYNCSLVNQTSESLEVDCSEGFDGGQRQWFSMEVFDQQTGMLQANVSAKLPVFTVGGLDAGRLLTIRIFAANVKGRSEPVVLETFTLKAAEKQTGPHKTVQISGFLSLGIFLGLLGLLVCLATVTLAMLKMRSAQMRGDRSNPGGSKGTLLTRPGNLPIKEKISVPLSQACGDEMYDEKNPDVVPYNEDADYKLKSAAQTPATLHLSSVGVGVGVSLVHGGGGASGPVEHCAMIVGAGDDHRNVYLNKTDEPHYAELSINSHQRHQQQQQQPQHHVTAMHPATAGGLGAVGVGSGGGGLGPSCIGGAMGVIGNSAGGGGGSAGTCGGVSGTGSISIGSTGSAAAAAATAAAAASASQFSSASVAHLTSTLQRQQHQHHLLQQQQQQQQQHQLLQHQHPQLQQHQQQQQQQQPAYDYFDEPTIYAQIDHYKSTSTMASGIVGGIIGGGGGGGAASVSSSSVVSPGNIVGQQQQQPSGGGASAAAAAAASTTTPASSSAATSPFPTVISSPSSTISTSLYPTKSFSREIVTIRTPLMYTQQESCV